MKSILVFLLMITLYGACRSSKSTQEHQSESEVDFEIYTYKIPKDNYTNYLVYVKSKQILLPEECWVQCQNKRVDFAPTEIKSIYEYPIYVPSSFYSVETRLDLNKCNTLHFIANRRQYDFSVEFREPKEMFQVFPQILNIADTIIVFVLDLLRVKPPKDEYFPTSERLRIEITNKMGKVVWNSDYDLNFLQVIGQVEPVEVGKVQRYIVPWNRVDNSGNFVDEGDLSVSFVLPIKPSKLVTTMKLILKKIKK